LSACETSSPLAETLLAQSPGLPKSPEGDPVFPEPFAAEAFAMTVHLHERGLFTWGEWALALSSELRKPGKADDGSDYFDSWVLALATLIGEKGVTDEAAIAALQRSWQRAAEATPHGMPIELANDPER
jgi:nitrile hydratase accessory protein